MEYRTTEPVEDKSKTRTDSEISSEDYPRILKIDEAKIQDHLGQMVRQSVEETLNGLLEAEADRLCQAGRYAVRSGRTRGLGITRGRCTRRPGRWS